MSLNATYDAARAVASGFAPAAEVGGFRAPALPWTVPPLPVLPLPKEAG